MTTHRIRLSGPGARGHRVAGPLLRDLLGALIDSAQQALRLRVEGRSRAHGRLPAWLEKATAFDVVAFEEGSTVLVVEALPLSEAAPERFRQLPLFTPVDPGRTSLELLEESLGDALGERTDSELYDAGLIDTFEGFGRVLRSGIDRIELGARRPIRLDDGALRILGRLRAAIPGDQQVLLAGKLDALGHSDRFFTLVLDSGDRAKGVLAGEEIDLDELGRLWGKPVAVHGVAKFRPSGALLRIDAERIEAAVGDQSLWSRMPRPVLAETELRLPPRAQGTRSGVAAIFGRWPGDESDEEITRALDELS